jgi:hypothetical protein
LIAGGGEHTMIKNIPEVPRKELIEYFKEEINNILDLVQYKNGNYGDNEDAFFNFRNSARRIENDISPNSMYKMLMTYMDKHLCALAKNKMDDSEFVERNRDVIVYSLIAIAMKRSLDKNGM